MQQETRLIYFHICQGETVELLKIFVFPIGIWPHQSGLNIIKFHLKAYIYKALLKTTECCPVCGTIIH